jgi:glutamate racemase
MIGVFDSGVGGLTVLKSLLEHLPGYDYIYLGDNSRAPYGNKTREQIYQYTREAVDFLFKQGCDLIVVACNTASALALRKLQQEYLPKKYPGKKVLGVVRPMAEAIAGLKNKQKIGIIGTKATIGSRIYHQEIKKFNDRVKILSRSTPLLVQLIEGGLIDEKETEIILEKYLQSFKTAKIDSLILGCTHYPFLEKQICQIMGKSCKIYNSGEIVALSLQDYLKRHNELGLKQKAKPKLEFYTTGDKEKFKMLGERFLGRKIENIKRAVLN